MRGNRETACNARLALDVSCRQPKMRVTYRPSVWPELANRRSLAKQRDHSVPVISKACIIQPQINDVQ